MLANEIFANKIYAPFPADFKVVEVCLAKLGLHNPAFEKSAIGMFPATTQNPYNSL